MNRYEDVKDVERRKLPYAQKMGSDEHTKMHESGIMLTRGEPKFNNSMENASSKEGGVDSKPQNVIGPSLEGKTLNTQPQCIVRIKPLVTLDVNDGLVCLDHRLNEDVTHNQTRAKVTSSCRAVYNHQSAPTFDHLASNGNLEIANHGSNVEMRGPIKRYSLITEGESTGNDGVPNMRRTTKSKKKKTTLEGL
ncbi:hypothetical protein VNO78_15641 [Psophocarpus tetragonolobus]|uniref:Uncharacterized protein n=1 Tax=Psophocarpus tetragonolobus TaxID=3891 RepID=A0AAN9XJY7_PSOTE